jgi:hypothetical protein
MNKKKIGLLALALVLSLGAIGVGYASWTDQIFVTGTVNTGSVNLEIVELSSTYVVKVPDEVAGEYDDTADEMVVVHQRVNMRPPTGGLTWSVVNVPPMPPIPPNILVASAIAASPADDEISVTFCNAFPCVELTADFIVHNDGSIPVYVDATITDFTGDPEDVALLAAAATVEFYYWDEENQQVGNEITECPVQLHYCDYVYCVMTLHLPQEDEYQGLNGGFTATIDAIQWNKYGE